MSRSTEQLSVHYPPRQRQLLIRSVHALPRSVSVADLHLDVRPQRFERDRLELRRVPPSINDLRLLAQKQNNAILIADPSKPQSTDDTTSRTQLSNSSNANVKVLEESGKQRRRQRYKSYQDMHILSMYQENMSLNSIPSTWLSREDSIQSESTVYHASDSESSRDSSPRPKTPSDRSFCENPANIKDTMSEHEKVRKVNARRVQVVEHSQRQEPFHAETDEEILHATMLVGPGKPKLVQIQRPMSSSNSRRDFPSPSQHDNFSQPSTPICDQPEVSLFSPYDTPVTGTPFSDVSTVTSPITPTPQNHMKLSLQTNLSMFQTQPVTPQRIISPQSDVTMFSTDQRRMKSLADPFRSPLSHRSSYISCGSSYTDESPPELTRSSTLDNRSVSDDSIMNQVVQQEKYLQSISKAISSTAKALDAAAINDFSLIHPELSSFRSHDLQSRMDNILLSSLQKVFPQVSSSSLSIIAAWLVVDQHFTQLFAAAPPELLQSAISSSYTFLPNEPVKMSVSARPSPIVSQNPWEDLVDLPAPSSTPPRKRSISTPINTSHIPSKAKSFLGISSDLIGCKSQPQAYDVPNGTNASTKRARLEEKARYVHSSVQIVGQKLVKDIMAAVSTSSMTSCQDSKSSRRSKHMRDRSSTVGPNSSTSMADEIAVKPLWEACRCLASMA